MLALAAVTALVACAVALQLGGGGPVSVPSGLPDAGAVTGWGLRAAAALAKLTAVLTVGSLLVGAVLLPASRDRTNDHDELARRAVVTAGRCAAAWAALTAAVFVLTVSDTAGVPLIDLSPELMLQLGSWCTSEALRMPWLLPSRGSVSWL